MNTPIQLRPCPKAYTRDLDKCVSPRQTIERVRQALADSGLDVLAETRRVDTGRLGIPVYLSVCGRDARRIMPTRKQMGKGSSAEQAQASALMELMERYAFFSFWEARPHMVTATWQEAEQRFGSELMPVEEILRSVDDTLAPEAAREVLSTVRWSFYPATRLADGQTVWTPLDWFKLLGEFNGTSAGNSAEESLLQGLSELVERHVCCRIDRERPTTPSIDMDTLDDPVLADLCRRFAAQGIRLVLKDFSLDMPLPTVAALAWDPATFPDRSEIVFTVPDGLTNGEYKVYVLRNDQRLLLGRTTINLLSDVPDQAGMNVKGIVSCGGQPVAGVVVSDGTEVTKTDAKGIYYLNSDKKNGYVFISVPSGYEVEHSGTTPQFFRYLNQPASTVEQRDFPLTKRDNDRHRVVVFTDVHLANRVSDRSQFQSGFLREMTDYLQSCRKENIPVYGIALGDLAWDSYWYDNNYDLSDYQNDLKSLDFPVFSAPGNHDNDPQIANNDFEAAAPFRQIVGPTDFSFNIGGIHYILLDNVV